jgi:hypothetical protein
MVLCKRQPPVCRKSMRESEILLATNFKGSRLGMTHAQHEISPPCNGIRPPMMTVTCSPVSSWRFSQRLGIEFERFSMFLKSVGCLFGKYEEVRLPLILLQLLTPQGVIEFICGRALLCFTTDVELRFEFVTLCTVQLSHHVRLE